MHGDVIRDEGHGGERASVVGKRVRVRVTIVTAVQQ